MSDGLGRCECQGCASLASSTQTCVTAEHCSSSCCILRRIVSRLCATSRRVLFQDAAGGLFLYDAERGELMVPPDWAGGQLRAAAWDGADQRLVAAVSSTGELRWGLAGFGLFLEVSDHDAQPCLTFFTII